MIKFIKKNLIPFFLIQLLLMVISMLKNGISTTYIYISCLALVLPGSIFFLFTRLMKNSSFPGLFIMIFFYDILILFSFVYSLIERQDSILYSYLLWAAVPLRNVMVFFSKVFNVKA